MSAMDVLTNANARKVLDQGLAPPEAAGPEALGSGGLPSLEAFDARLRRTLEAHVSRAESAQVRLRPICRAKSIIRVVHNHSL
jgi:hypothetical protein